MVGWRVLKTYSTGSLMWSSDRRQDRCDFFYSKIGLNWSPEKLLDRCEFVQYNWLELVTREVVGQV